MVITSIKKSHLLLGILLIVLMLCIVCRPTVYMQATLQGVVVWGTAVLPALFPFFFLTTILSSLNILDKLARAFRRPFGALFHTSPYSSLVYLMSIISGYPVGAKLICDLYQNNKIDKYEAVRINAFTSCSGPVFILGTVGSTMLKDMQVGAIILVVHFLGAFLNGLVYRNYGKKQSFKAHIPLDVHKKIDDVLGNAIHQSVLSVLTVGGYIALSFMFCAFLSDTHLISILSAPLEWLLNVLGLHQQMAQGIILGLTEITRGCLELSNFTTLNMDVVTVLCSGIIAFGGLSVTLQSMTFLKKCGVSLKVFLLQKTTQSLITIALAILAVSIF